jgi:hypothetical protein
MANITSSPARQRDQRPGGVTGRDAYIAAQALIYAIEAIGELPDWRQEKSARHAAVARISRAEPAAASAYNQEPALALV